MEAVDTLIKQIETDILTRFEMELRGRLQSQERACLEEQLAHLLLARKFGHNHQSAHVTLSRAAEHPETPHERAARIERIRARGLDAASLQEAVAALPHPPPAHQTR